MSIKILILTGYGINAEKELAYAFEKAGGNANIIHLEDVLSNKKILEKYQILAFPGGFSFGDHIASGKVFANIIKNNLLDELIDFINKDKLVIGICNGFQIITKLGIVPDIDNNSDLRYRNARWEPCRNELVNVRCRGIRHETSGAYLPDGP